MPPFVGTAVNVAEDPAQIIEDGTLIVTDGVTTGFTVMVIIELFAVVGLAHVALEVSTQRIASPLTIPVPATAEYVALFAPIILLPFLVHWYAGEVPPFVGTAV